LISKSINIQWIINGGYPKTLISRLDLKMWKSDIHLGYGWKHDEVYTESSVNNKILGSLNKNINK
jgi:hypothetical protein